MLTESVGVQGSGYLESMLFCRCCCVIGIVIATALFSAGVVENVSVTAEVDGDITSNNHENVAFWSKFDLSLSRLREDLTANFESRFSSIRDDISSLRKDLTAADEANKDELMGYFHHLHNFSYHRVETLKRATLQMEICPGQLVTAHAAYLDGRVFLITVAHSVCPDIRNNTNVNLCDGIDVALLGGCPLSEEVSQDEDSQDTEDSTHRIATHMLNITDVANMRMGDKGVAFGFSDDEMQMWEGELNALVGKIAALRQNGSHVEGPAHFKGPDRLYLLPREFVLGGNQVMGMSGAAVANGCGYLGVAHARPSGNLAAFPSGVVIPAKEIKKCFKQFESKFETLASCKYNDDLVLQIPVSPSCGFV